MNYNKDAFQDSSVQVFWWVVVSYEFGVLNLGVIRDEGCGMRCLRIRG